MLWIKSGIENPSKSEVTGRCGGDEKTNDHAEPTKVERLKKPLKKQTHACNNYFGNTYDSSNM